MSASVLPEADQIVAGYTIVRPVGEGGMGVVYEAVHPRHGTAAIKILRPEKLDDEELITEFQNEAVATASVAHECVVEVYGCGHQNGYHHIIMEFVDGPTLERLLAAKGRLHWKLAVRIIKQVAKALAHAHDLGLIHRDVKPGNVLLYMDGRARLTDFGIVKDISTLKGFLVNGRRVGTPAYASPEQCLGKRLSSATDIYSLGATLYHMVCGRPPFLGETRSQVMKKHVIATPPPPRTFVKTLPKALANLLMKMLAKKQTARPADMAGVVRDLEFIESGKIVIGATRRS